jgi:hypothetical protein
LKTVLLAKPPALGLRAETAGALIQVQTSSERRSIMSFFSWLRNRTSNRAPRGRAQHRSAAPRSRPHLEALEDRWMPSFVTVPLSNVVGASAVAVGDFNNDGKLDVASIYTDDMAQSHLIVNLGGGNGHFGSSPSANAGVFPGSDVTSMAVGNFNNDKYLDLIVTNNTMGQGGVKVLLGIGGGRFKSGGFARVGGNAPGPNPTANAVAVGDFNRDGKLDAVVACSTETDLLLGDGKGGFTSVQRVGPGARSVAVADLNHDGILDLVLGSGPGIQIELGDGHGGFGAPQSFALPGYAASIALADLNGDGQLDIVTATKYGTGGGETDVLLGNGDGTFRAAQTVGPYAEAVAVADFNHDGKLDIVSVGYGSTNVELGNGDGTFQSAIYVGRGGHSVAVGDFNGDGYADLTTGNQVFLNDKQW